MLKLEGVTKRFGERVVLNAVSFEVAAGEYVAVLGDSGIGKSTLLNVIAGLEPVDSGGVVFQNKDLTALGDDELSRLRRDCFGFVFQAFHVLPHLTVEENVALPLLLRAQVKQRGAAGILVTHSEAAAAGCDRRYRLTTAGLTPL